MISSSFSQTMSVFERSTIFHTEDNARVNIRDTEFSENHGLVSSVLNIESGSSVQCTNCSVHNNFALTGGMSIVSTNGYFNIINSTITDNHAIQVPVAQLFDASDPSIIDSSEVFLNSPITPTQFESEVAS